MTSDDNPGITIAADESGKRRVRLGSVDERFHQYVESDPSLLERSSYPELSTPHPFLRYPLQAWPTFLGTRARAALVAAATRMLPLLRRAPRQLHASDPERFGRLFGCAPSVARALRLLALTDDLAHGIGRVDFYLTERGFRCLEFNLAGPVGGWQGPFMADKVLSAPGIRKFVEREKLELQRPDVVRALFRHVLTHAPNAATGSRVAFCIVPPDSADLLELYRTYLSWVAKEAASEVGVAAPAVALHATDEFSLDGDVLVAAGERVDALVEATLDEERSEAYDACLDAAIAAGKLMALNGPATPLQFSKVGMALVSEDEARGQLAPEDAAMVRSCIPWTRVVERRVAHDPDGKLESLAALAARRRADLVLKPAGGFGGRGVLVGRTTDDATWASAFAAAAAEGGWIVQQYVQPAPAWYQCGERGAAPHAVVWGAFVHGERYASSFLRMQPGLDGDVVNSTRGAVEGVVFDVPDD